ncbi:MAG: translocation/assembly module TamB [Cytophagales bacterium]|nr:translocation/assembly module TamB [Cytophagales bacterium]
MNGENYIAKVLKRIIRILLWAIGSFIAVSLGLSLLLLVPAVQQFAVNKATGFISSKTNMPARVGSIHIGFPKTIVIGDVHVEDLEKDTLLYCKKISVNTGLLPLIGKKIDLHYLLIDGLKGKVKRNREDSSFNFSPLSDIFSGTDQKKDKPDSNWKIGMDEVVLENIDLGFYDRIDSTIMELRLGHLDIQDNSSDIANSIFDLKSINVKNVDFSLLIGDKFRKDLRQIKPKAPAEIPVTLNLQRLDAGNITFDLGFASEKLQLSAMLQEARVVPEIIDLTSRQILLQQLSAHKIDVDLKINPADSAERTVAPELDPEVSLTGSTFGNFDWNFVVKHAELAKAGYKMDLNDETRKERGMDYQHMEFTDFNVTADSLFFNKENTGATVTALSVKEISGPEIKTLKGNFFMDNTSILAGDFEIKTANSRAQGDIALSYPGLRKIGKEIGRFGIRSDIRGVLGISDVQPYYSIFDAFPALQNVEALAIKKFESDGILSDLKLNTAEVALGNSTYLRALGEITGLPTSDIEISVEVDTLYTSGSDLMQLLPDSLRPGSLRFPAVIGANFTGRTDLSSADLSTVIASDFGQIQLDANMAGDKFFSEVSLAHLDLGALLNDSIFGALNLDSKIEGTLAARDMEQVNVKSALKSLEFNGYTYQDGDIDVGWVDDEFTFSLNLRDSALTAGMNGSVWSGDSINHYKIALNLINSELHTLNFFDEFFKLNGNIMLDMDIKSKDDFSGWIKAENIGLQNEEDAFGIDSMHLDVDINAHYTNFLLNSEIMNASLTGNTKISELEEAIVDHIDLYIELPDSMVMNKNFEFEFDLDLKRPDIFTEFLVPGLDEVRLDRCFLRYDDESNELNADIRIPAMSYRGFLFNDLAFLIDSDADSARTSLTLNSISYDSAVINNISAETIFKPNQADIEVRVHDLYDRLKYQFMTRLGYNDRTYTLRIDPDQTIINYERWDLPDDNFLKYEEGKFIAQSTEFGKDDQQFWLNPENNTLVLNFKNFKLGNIANIIEYDSLNNLVSGEINGRVMLEDPLTDLTVRSELTIPNLAVFGEYLGDFYSKADFGKQLNFDLRVQNGANRVLANGIVPMQDSNDPVSLMLESDIANAAPLQPFLSSFVSDLSGGFRGRLSVTERNGNPSFHGKFDLDHLNFVLIPVNAQLKNNGRITFEDNLIAFDKFVVKDSLNQAFDIRGNIDLRNFKNPKYDLQLKTDNFLAINSIPNSELPVFGQLFLGLDVEISGHQSNLAVSSAFSINENTDITYVMPGKELELIKDEGIVEFYDFDTHAYETSKRSPDQFVGDSLIALIEGIDFTAQLKVDPEARFTVMVDPNSGDFTKFRFTGNLHYKYNDKQRGVLNGLIEVEDGFYELSFYGLVKKRFDYDPESTVTWSGDVMEGMINFAAKHSVRTNSVALVSNEISSHERAIYNQRLPYDVILKVQDRISYPTISFELDLPERHRSTYPTLDSKLNMLNQPAMEAERNKQVFALLVGGTFIPENPEVQEGSSSGNFATTAARNSVNAIMTQQLNRLTGQFIQGFDVDMGVNTFDDFAGGSAQTRTQLDVKVSKNLFNDRVSAEMESHINLDGSNKQVASQSTAGMTEFAVSYKLTRTGNYRVKAFRENAYDIFDGEIQNAGIAFIFVREFDGFGKRKNTKPPDAGKGKVELQGVNE